MANPWTGLGCLLLAAIIQMPGLQARASGVAPPPPSLPAAAPAPVFHLLSATASPYVFGNYVLAVDCAGDPHNGPLVAVLKKAALWRLRVAATEKGVALPLPKLAAVNGVIEATFSDLDLNHADHYQVSFKGGPFLAVAIPDVAGMDLDAFEKEKGRTGAWTASLHPRFIQVSGTAGNSLQPGVDVDVAKNLHQSLDLDLGASLGLDKNDPNNHEDLSLAWQPGYALSPGGYVGTDWVGLKLQGSASQSLLLEDCSGGLRSSLALHPIDGLQPVYITAGLDAALRHTGPGQDYSDPRTFVEASWGWEGLVGPGSHLRLLWEYWYRMDQWNPAADPAEPTQREYVQVELSMPLWQDKNVELTYADGALPPFFVPQTTVKAGLEIFWDAGQIYDSRPAAPAADAGN